MDIRLAWEEFRNNVDANSLTISYVDKDGNYYLFAVKNSVQLVCVLPKEDASEFEDDYKTNSTSIV